MKKCKKYAVYTEDVKFKDRFKVPNFLEIPKYKTKKEALKKAIKKDGDKVFCVD